MTMLPYHGLGGIMRPDDILIEHPDPNEVSTKEVMTNCGLTFMQVSINFVRTVMAIDTLMGREGLSFSASDLLNVYTVVRPKREFNTNLFPGNHYLRLRKNQQSWSRLVTKKPNKDLYLDEFIWVLENWKLWAGNDWVWSFKRTKGSITNGRI
ncbi:hypothetical protein Acr_10g0008170 [Actinidia rufa]|uniref:Uncharacterized protein n=1 Tax=Actinidia rufa TaxID=165716 RepID=A0A7J0F9Q3_9ERIC|nr:hypothetical protein Acr_10g0008170 [Actinidia rufa]